MLLLFLFGIAGCEKDFQFEEDPTAKKMTINCLFDNLQNFHVYVTQSTSITGNTSLLPIKDALVELYRNDSIISTMPFFPSDTADTFGSYQTNFSPTEAHKYSIKVSHPLYGTAIAEDFMPSIPVVSTFSLNNYGSVANNYLARFQLLFQDNGSDQDFYRVNTFISGNRWIHYSPTDSSLENFALGARAEILSPISDLVSDHGWALLFSDKNCNGQLKPLELEFQVSDSTFYENLYLTVELHHVSQKHYEYFRTLEKYGAANQNTDPVRVYNNIQNGYGIFAGTAIHRMTVVVK